MPEMIDDMPDERWAKMVGSGNKYLPRPDGLHHEQVDRSRER